MEEILVFVVERFATLVENKRTRKKGRKGGCVACDGRRGMTQTRHPTHEGMIISAFYVTPLTP